MGAVDIILAMAMVVTIIQDMATILAMVQVVGKAKAREEVEEIKRS